MYFILEIYLNIVFVFFTSHDIIIYLLNYAVDWQQYVYQMKYV